MSRYHKAAADGYLDLLKEATRKDLNTPDKDGMTPTSLAAFHGHVEALQLICSRGGNPNISDIWGNTPLHLAAANGHMHILSFLVSFNANLFALDNEFHTAIDVAASRNQMDCVRFLDASTSQQTTRNPKRVAGQKKQAAKEAEKRVKECEKVQKRHKNKMDKMSRGADTLSLSEASRASTLSGRSAAGSVNENYSALIAAEKSGSLTARVKGTLQMRLGKKDKGTLQRSKGDENVIFVQQDNGMPENPDFLGVFHEQDEMRLGEETEEAFDEDPEEESGQSSIFNRPGLGGLIFRNKLNMEDMLGGNDENLGYLVQNELLTEGEDAAGFGGNDDTELPWSLEDIGLDDDEGETSPIDVFLSCIGLTDFALVFDREHLDLEALTLCSDEDLKGIRIQLGPRKKILEAIEHRKNALENSGLMKESKL